MSIVRYDPLSLMNLDKLFDRQLKQLDEEANTLGHWTPSVDIKAEANNYLILVDIPGVDPNDVQISIENKMVMIKGQRDIEKKEKREGYSRIEREYGSFYRRFTLPDDADIEKIDAHSKHGVLELVIPKKKPSVTQKTIKIKVAKD